MYGKEKLLYCIKVSSTIKLETSNYNIAISTYVDFAAHLQKDWPSSLVMPESV